jgi:hypothetical protein
MGKESTKKEFGKKKRKRVFNGNLGKKKCVAETVSVCCAVLTPRIGVFIFFSWINY